MATVHDYEVLDSAIPLRSIELLPWKMPPQQAWNVLLHAMMLRKYTLAANDKVYLPRVVDALSRLAREFTGDEHADFLDAVAAWAPDACSSAGQGTRHHYGGTLWETPEMVRKILYGRFLHGDAGKRAALPDDFHHLVMPVFDWSTDSAHAVRILAQWIQIGVNSGALPADLLEGFEPYEPPSQ